MTALSIAFTGAVFAWPYQAGVAAYIQERGLLDPATSRIYGSSSGAIVATMLACGVDVRGVGAPAAFDANERAQQGARTPFFKPSVVLPMYTEIWGGTLPGDAHQRANGRLHVVVRQLARWRPRVVSRFPTRQRLIDALSATIAVPGLTVRLAYRVHEYGWCVDPGYEVPLDDRPGVRTIRVGVSGAAADHIAPSRKLSWREKYLVAPRAQRLALMDLGYADARRWFGP